MMLLASDRTSTHGPLLENRSRPPSAVPDPAVRTCGYAPGASAWVLPSLPEGATTITPALNACAIATVSTRLSWGVASATAPAAEMLMTPAPAFTAAVIAFTTTSLELLPDELKMRTEKT